MQRDQLRRGAQVVVGTTGRVMDHIKRRWLDLGSVKFVVLDEADTMLDMGFIDDVDFILGIIPGEEAGLHLLGYDAAEDHRALEEVHERTRRRS